MSEPERGTSVVAKNTEVAANEEMEEAHKKEGQEGGKDECETAFPVFCLSKPTDEVDIVLHIMLKKLVLPDSSTGRNSSTMLKFNNDDGGHKNRSSSGSYSAPRISWIPMPSKPFSRSHVLFDFCAANKGKAPTAYPFLNTTVDEIYRYWKTLLRPPSDSLIWEAFTNNTFLIIDDECLTKEPKEILVCSDAPDYTDPENNNDNNPPSP